MEIDRTSLGEFAELTAEIVSAYVSNNAIGAQDLPSLISSVHAAVTALGAPPAPAEAEKPAPAVAIKKSVTDDYLISLEDGRRYKALKRHLTGLGMTPALYRAKWGLPHDYPMVAPNYAKQRSELAKSLGLGRKPAAPAPMIEPPAVEQGPAAKRARSKKA